MDLLTDLKHNQIKKVMERIIDGIDEQLRMYPSAIVFVIITINNNCM
jgi:hypothetical protein